MSVPARCPHCNGFHGRRLFAPGPWPVRTKPSRAPRRRRRLGNKPTTTTTATTRVLRSDTQKAQAQAQAQAQQTSAASSSGLDAEAALHGLPGHVLRSTHRTLAGQRQALVRSGPPALPDDMARPDVLRCDPVRATLLFAGRGGRDEQRSGRDGGGATAVCISPCGVLLTCARNVASASGGRVDVATPHCLLFASGAVVLATVVAWDAQLDLALLVVTPPASSPPSSYPYVRLALRLPAPYARLVCIGHPGGPDPAPLTVSLGTVRGRDAAAAAALRHSCWTDWGHAGAPLFDRRSGCLVGLHTSWDEATGVRRAVLCDALVAFVERFEGRGEDVLPGWKWLVRG